MIGSEDFYWTESVLSGAISEDRWFYKMILERHLHEGSKGRINANKIILGLQKKKSKYTDNLSYYSYIDKSLKNNSNILACYQNVQNHELSLKYINTDLKSLSRFLLLKLLAFRNSERFCTQGWSGLGKKGLCLMSV